MSAEKKERNGMNMFSITVSYSMMRRRKGWGRKDNGMTTRKRNQETLNGKGIMISDPPAGLRTIERASF